MISLIAAAIESESAQSWLVTFAIVVFTILFAMWQRSQKPKGFPPGYSGVPILGMLPFMSDNPSADFYKWGQKVGPLMSVQVGRNDLVVVNNYEVAYDVNLISSKATSLFMFVFQFFINNGKVTSGRPDLRIQNDTCKGYGFGIQDYSETFKTLKKFTATAFQK